MAWTLSNQFNCAEITICKFAETMKLYRAIFSLLHAIHLHCNPVDWSISPISLLGSCPWTDQVSEIWKSLIPGHFTYLLIIIMAVCLVNAPLSFSPLLPLVFYKYWFHQKQNFLMKSLDISQIIIHSVWNAKVWNISWNLVVPLWSKSKYCNSESG